MYSSYKSDTTLKSHVVSSLYTGSISDKELTKCCVILHLLECNDGVMADKGFNTDLLRSKGVQLNLPPYLLNHAEFSPKEVKETKTIGKIRIHVERAIRLIKEFHLFDSEIPMSLLGTVNQMWTVACLLVNF